MATPVATITAAEPPIMPPGAFTPPVTLDEVIPEAVILPSIPGPSVPK
jgi:hypothetical protein